MSAGARFDECLAAASLRKAFQTLGNLPVGEKGGWGGAVQIDYGKRFKRLEVYR